MKDIKKKLEESTGLSTGVRDPEHYTKRRVLKEILPLILYLIYKAGGPELTAIDFYSYLEELVEEK